MIEKKEFDFTKNDVMGIHMTASQQEALWTSMDKDESGTISYHEFVNNMKWKDRQLTAAELESVQKRMAVEKAAGRTEVNPLLKGEAAPKTRELFTRILDKVYQKGSELTPIFRKFDENHDGHLNYRELKQGLEHLGCAVSDSDFRYSSLPPLCLP